MVAIDALPPRKGWECVNFTFIILSSHTYAMIFVQKENENAVINGVLAKDSSF